MFCFSIKNGFFIRYNRIIFMVPIILSMFFISMFCFSIKNGFFIRYNRIIFMVPIILSMFFRFASTLHVLLHHIIKVYVDIEGVRGRKRNSQYRNQDYKKAEGT